MCVFIIDVFNDRFKWLTVISLFYTRMRAPSPATDAGEGAHIPKVGCKDNNFPDIKLKYKKKNYHQPTTATAIADTPENAEPGDFHAEPGFFHAEPGIFYAEPGDFRPVLLTKKWRRSLKGNAGVLKGQRAFSRHLDAFRNKIG